ncbi:hypothetical protein OK015_24765 [Mycobacterium sp. Aquia_216]|nr:hypothetical protein [Mycobacterium sp. Aquia_216]WAJ44310.1 hypothetical protein OK015_24765 [Mycobacterium sp. Aquia_216]
MTAVISGIATIRPQPDAMSSAAMALAACERACADAGLAPSDIDGVVKLSYDGSISTMALAQQLNMGDLHIDAELPLGGGSVGAMLQMAAMAVEAGAARHVLCFRAVSGRQWMAQVGGPDLHRPYYLDTANYLRPAGWTGYMHVFAHLFDEHARRYGTTREALGNVAVDLMANAIAAGVRPEGDALTLDDYLAVPPRVGPFNKYDQFTIVDTASAAVVSPADHGSRCDRPVVEIAATTQSQGTKPMGWYDNSALRGSALDGAARVVARELYEAAGLSPRDIDVAHLYDCNTFSVLYLLEETMLCERGAAAALVGAGGALRAAGSRPVNTDGGDLASGYGHGFRHIVEAAHQLRGTAACQVPDAEFALVMGGAVGVTSGAILRRSNR